MNAGEDIYMARLGTYVLDDDSEGRASGSIGLDQAMDTHPIRPSRKRRLSTRLDRQMVARPALSEWLFGEVMSHTIRLHVR